MQQFQSYRPVEYSNTHSVIEFFSVLVLGSFAVSELYLLGKSFYKMLQDKRTAKEDNSESDNYNIVKVNYDLFDDLISDNRQVIIVRSVPGAGRRQLIKELSEYADDESSIICDINDYFTNNGKYNFKGKDISKAEDYSLVNFVKAIKNETNLIFVSGHFYETWMYDKYIEIAKLAGYEYRVVSMECRDKNELKRFNKRSTHNVPYSRSLKIYENWEEDSNEVEVPTFNDEEIDNEYKKYKRNTNEECLIVTSDEEN